MKVSVIVPFYNTEKYLPACLESLVGQLPGELEVICVDDGSTDGSRAVVESYADKLPGLRIFSQRNQGQGAARNAGIREAKGEYLCFLDSDDSLSSDSLEKLYLRARRDELDVLYFAGTSEYETAALAENHESYFDRAYRREDNGGAVMTGREMLAFQRDRHQMWKTACMMLIRREYLTQAGIFFQEGVVYEDNAFSVRTCLRAKRTGITSEVYYHRLVRDRSTVTTEKSHRNLYGYIAAVLGELQEMQNLEEHEILSLVMGDTLYNVASLWQELTEEELEKLKEDFSPEPISCMEEALYQGLMLPFARLKQRMERRLREEVERRENTIRLQEEKLNRREKELERTRQKLENREKDIAGLKETIAAREQEIQGIYQSRSYRLGNTLLSPAAKVKEALKGG